MARRHKESVAVSFKLEKSINEKLCEYSTQTGMPKTIVIEKALAMYLENNAKTNNN